MLEVCDRLGILVLEEFSDAWDIPKVPDDYNRHFAEWWQRDLSAMVLRDRNHPSIIYWSIGNEIPSDPNKYGPKLAALVKSLDTTRPVGRGGMNVARLYRRRRRAGDLGLCRCRRFPQRTIGNHARRAHRQGVFPERRHTHRKSIRIGSWRRTMPGMSAIGCGRHGTNMGESGTGAPDPGSFAKGNGSARL